ncbi:hypothetical protein MSG28_003610 [Choristoneura fumiferana]|uniref:Uncharacterized protein n=1 Tax=Choristoneura fumiferana TaxID=7141 RepID=A0ACC0KGT3_CHOFU|nr:hypothetical protein MSG28_003610 [Choristoneura fumiferana]
MSFTRTEHLEAADNRIHRLFFLNRMHTMRCLDFRNNLIDEISELDFLIWTAYIWRAIRLKAWCCQFGDADNEGCPYMGGTGEEEADAGGGKRMTTSSEWRC